MIAAPIGSKLRMAAVASPEYFARCAAPQTPRDLMQHCCINERMVQSGKIYAWEFEQENGKFHVRVEGQLTFNTSEHVVDAALAGLGIAFLPEEEFGTHLQEGKLIRVLEEWCRPFPGYYLYYPSRKQPSPAFSLVVDALRINRKM